MRPEGQTRPHAALFPPHRNNSGGHRIPDDYCDRAPTGLGVGNSVGLGPLGVRLGRVAQPSEDNPSSAQVDAQSALATPILKPGVMVLNVEHISSAVVRCRFHYCVVRLWPCCGFGLE